MDSSSTGQIVSYTAQYYSTAAGGSGIGQIIFAVVLLMFGILFSMSETALTSVSTITVRRMKEEGKKRAAAVEKLINKKDKLLSSVLIGNNMVTILLTTIITSFAIHVSTSYETETRNVAIATAVTSLVVIVFGDIMPKVIATKNPSKISLGVSRPISWVVFILSPISTVLNAVINKTFSFMDSKDDAEEQEQKKQELKTYIEMSSEDSVIEEEESNMIEAVLEFKEGDVRDIMTPRVDMVAISIDSTYEQILEVFKEERFSRLPVFGEDSDDIVGTINFKDFILEGDKNNFKLEAPLMRVPYFAMEYQSTSALFSHMKSVGATIAIIKDEFGGTAGLCTLEDLIETIVGDIFDEDDQEDKEEKEKEIAPTSNPDEYLITGTVRLEDFNEFFGRVLQSSDYDTVAGYVMGLFEYIPEEGESIEYQGMTFTVETLERNIIASLRAKIEMPEEPEEEDEQE
ncbi:MAG: hemolysin family protein [Defluviitaleaceae bacterium]|nr:hemolysin family protein [Defluviitaleaceae bacterium]